jgi:dipeptidyl aminopeptidase/acylaminoacyl peptidase
LGPRAELVIFEGSDHGFTRPKGAIAALALTATAWIDRILDT